MKRFYFRKSPCRRSRVIFERFVIKKEWLLASGTILLTTVIFLMLIRWLAPQLLGLPLDLQMVQTSKSVPPFFEGIFRKEDYANDSLILKDPYTNIRFKPLLQRQGGVGPHDLLGFRNPAIPNRADVVTIGDSQTYGVGDTIENNWPSQLSNQLRQRQYPVYNMGIGGWGAIQYLDMFPKAALLNPRVVVIAFYSGNDALESFVMAYGNEHWSKFRINPELGKSDAPQVTSTASLDEAWLVTFKDGTNIAFTPKARLDVNNIEHPAVLVGYDIMAEVARQISTMAMQHGISVVFTVIPTRELVYERKITQDGIEQTKPYRQLVILETGNIDRLALTLGSLPEARYVDLVKPLQDAALTNSPLYPRKWDGHPGPRGYQIIASALAETIDQLLDAADKDSPN